jgi:hypothetical protein
LNTTNNPITKLENGILTAIRDVTIDGVKVFANAPFEKVMAYVGSDEQIANEMFTRSSEMPLCWLRWVGWAGLEEKALGNIRGMFEQGGNIQFDLFVGCAAPRSKTESRLGVLGVTGYQDLVIGIMEQVHPVQAGFNTARHSAINSAGVLWMYFGDISLLTWHEQAVVLKMRLMAVLASAQ